jgi:hypothetical protein
MKDGLWYRGNQVVVPYDLDLKELILRELHSCPSAAHRGQDRTLEKISRLFWWVDMEEEVRDFVRSCPSCQRNKAARQKPGGLLQPLPVPEYRWE